MNNRIQNRLKKINEFSDIDNVARATYLHRFISKKGATGELFGKMNDLRLYSENDIRFLRQFQSEGVA